MYACCLFFAVGYVVLYGSVGVSGWFCNGYGGYEGNMAFDCSFLVLGGKGFCWLKERCSRCYGGGVCRFPTEAVETVG